MRTIPLFRGFSDEELGELAALASAVPVKPDGLLFEVDDPASSFYLLTGGEVDLERPGDDQYKLRPPALIGELAALTSMRRNCRAVAKPGAEVWSLEAKTLQRYFMENQELGVRFLANLLEVVADKVDRDQRRMADMRKNLVRTQKALKRLRTLVLEAVETPISEPIHDTLDEIITHNRRVNYRVEPPAAIAAQLRTEGGLATVVELSRTHLSVQWPGEVPAVGSWLSGVVDLAGTEIPVSGKVLRNLDARVTIELDLLMDEYVAALEGYLTRVQLLDILV